MKQRILLMLMLLSVLTLWCGPAAQLMANPVGKDEAREKAMSFIGARHPALARGAQLDLKLALSQESYHVFNLGADEGFVIVSGDDCTDDILGYADSGTFSADDMPDNLRAWLDGYAEQIAWMKQRGITADGAGASSAPSSNVYGVSRSSIAPLLTCKWNQDDPYNRQTPDKRVTGCVATAIAQVMYYWYKTNGFEARLEENIPAFKPSNKNNPSLEKLTAPETFDWANMTDTYNSKSTEREKDAVAKLMKYVGYAVKTKYGYSGEGGSSASPFDIEPALKDKFGYESATDANLCDYSYEDWQTLVYTDLQAGRPVIYCGQSTGGGHQFVCDGYADGDYFHFNWGWGGSSDGYYKLALCNAKDQGIGGSTTNGAYYMSQKAVLAIHPTRSVSLAINPMTTADDDDLSLKSISIPTLHVNETYVISMSVSNSSKKDYNGVIQIKLNENDDWRRIGGITVHIPAKSTQSLDIKVTIPQISKGIYKLRAICSRPYKDGENLTTREVDIKDALPDLTGTIEIGDNYVTAESNVIYSLGGTVGTLSASSRHPQWQISRDGQKPWDDIEGATGTSYRPKREEVGKYIRASVSADGYHGVLVSDKRLVENPVLKGTVSIETSIVAPDAILTYKLSGDAATISKSDIHATWQYIYDSTGWKDVPGNRTTVITSDVGKIFRVKITADGYEGTLYSSQRKCEKWPCNITPVNATLENSTAYNQIVVTNPKANQEYIILNYKKDVSKLTESDWKNAKSDTPYNVLYMGGTVNTINYVYTRVKETDKMYAGTDVRMSSIYFGENIYTQGIELEVYKAVVSESGNYATWVDQEGNNSYYFKLGEVAAIHVKSIPANATNFKGIFWSSWINNSKNGSFYANMECTKQLESGQYYKWVFFKPKSQSNRVDIAAEFTKGYNDIAYDAVNLIVSDSQGRWHANYVEAKVEIGKGETRENIEAYISPKKAGLFSMSFIRGSGEGVAPVVTANFSNNTIAVDAKYATEGTHRYSVYQLGERIYGEIVVTVTKPKLEELRIMPQEIELDCGKSAQLTLQKFPEDAGDEITWSSSDNMVASVSDNGVVTVSYSANIGDTAIITAKAGDIEAKCKVTVPGEVYDIEIAGIRITTRNMNYLTALFAQLNMEALERYKEGNMEIKFDGSTLILKNAIIDTGESNNIGMILGMDNLNVFVEGECIVRSNNNIGMVIARDTKIYGNGALAVTGYNTGIDIDHTFMGEISPDGMDISLSVEGIRFWVEGGWNGFDSGLLDRSSLILNKVWMEAVGDQAVIDNFAGGIVLENCSIVLPEDAEIRDGSIWCDGEKATELIVYPVIKGDVNADKTIDVADIASVIDYMAKGRSSDIPKVMADVNGDGVVDVADIAEIIDIMAGQESSE